MPHFRFGDLEANSFLLGQFTPLATSPDGRSRITALCWLCWLDLNNIVHASIGLVLQAAVPIQLILAANTLTGNNNV